jgi:hypothetical protein
MYGEQVKIVDVWNWYPVSAKCTHLEACNTAGRHEICNWKHAAPVEDTKYAT